MSNPNIRGRPIQVRDEVVNLGSNYDYGVFSSGDDVLFQTFNTSTTPGTNFTIDCLPPWPEAIIDPHPEVKMIFTWALAGAGVTNAPYLVQAGQDGPRAFPIASVSQTTQVKLQNDTITTQTKSYFDAIIRTNTSYRDLDIDYSLAPSYLDQYSEYGYTGAGFPNLIVSNRNPLGSYDANVLVTPRGSFPQYEITYNGSTGATGMITSVEPLWCSPFIDNKKGFANVGKMLVTFTLTNLNNILSRSANHSSGTATATVNVQQCFLNFKYYKTRLYASVPKQLSYNYHEFNLINQTNFTLTSGQTQQISLPNVNMATYPQHMLVFAREQDSDFINNQVSGFTKTDTFANISQCIINFDKEQNLLSSASAEQIWEICRDNGVEISYPQWTGINYINGNTGQTGIFQNESGGVGSVLFLKVGRDLPCGDSAPGMIGNPVFGGKFTCTNINPSRSVNYTLFAYSVDAGVLNNDNGNITHNTSPLNAIDVRDALKEKEYILNKKNLNLFGGDFWQTIKDVASKVGNFAEKNILPIAEKLAPLARKLILGFGKKRKAKKGMGRIGGRIGGAQILGGDVLGGKKFTRAMMKMKMGRGLNDDEEDDQPEEIFDYADEAEMKQKEQMIVDEMLEMLKNGESLDGLF